MPCQMGDIDAVVLMPCQSHPKSLAVRNPCIVTAMMGLGGGVTVACLLLPVGFMLLMAVLGFHDELRPAGLHCTRKWGQDPPRTLGLTLVPSQWGHDPPRTLAIGLTLVPSLALTHPNGHSPHPQLCPIPCAQVISTKYHLGPGGYCHAARQA